MRLVRALTIGSLSLGLLLSACSDDDNEKTDGGTSVDAKSGDGKADTTPAVDAPIPDLDLSKKPVITAIIPSDGFADGGTLGYTLVLMTGENFAPDAAVYIDGSNTIMQVTYNSQASVSFKLPKNPYGNPTSGYNPYKADISIICNQIESDSFKFQYTKSKAMDAKLKGVVVSTSNSAYANFWSRDIEGKVYVEGVTDTSTGDSTKIKAYVGFGPTGKDPSKDAGWRWTEAKFSKDDGTYDLYAAKVKVPSEKSYDIAYRFSTDNGQHFIYADGDETDLKYDTAKAATITATKAPKDYCQENNDCLTATAFMFTCKLDSSDDTKHKCVGCLADKDCLSPMPNNLGPWCEASTQLCFCKTDADCPKNPLGKKCTSKHCGCAADSDCTGGLKCNSNAGYICM